ncbi:DNA polymerase III subunit delta [Candidatus Williamhamiltonella defendens]|uniref:DNA polymerase III subunit delta n=1 Tax=Candidatus Williamhamiltonella defendens TaxID=138072 RepID=UPI00130EA672|nr:DNA polymerase III subunit delta [Candidatus Hamiltonella defensa]
MKLIDAEQLQEHLKMNLSACYLLYGDEPLLLQESQDHIREAALQRNFTEHFTVTIEGDTEWKHIFRIFQELSLFSSRQTILVIFPHKLLPASMKDRLWQLVQLLHQNILLMMSFYKLTKVQENSPWYKTLAPYACKINCAKPNHQRLPAWIKTRSKSLCFDIDLPCIERLCECYEGNILALSQLLTLLSLVYPNEQLSLPKIEPLLNNCAHFTPYQWANTLLEGKTERALLILKKLQQEEHEPVILLRILQPDLLLLVTLKRAMAELPLITLLQQHQVWQSRRTYFTQALQRLSQNVLKQGVHLFCQIEISLKQDYTLSIWAELETLSLLLCGHPVLGLYPQSFTECFFDEP